MAFRSTCSLLLLLLPALLYLATPTNAALSDDEKAELIRAHNFYRAKAKPTPTNMVALEWDDELAALAQFYTVNCEIEPNENRHEQSTEYDYVGEILHGSANYSVNINLTSMVFNWFFEGRSYSYDLASCLDEDGEAAEELEGCEKYVQLVWAKTYKFGCGAYWCEEIMGLEEEVEDGQNALMVACYYGPGGGFVGETPYQSGGEPCSACPTDYELCQNSLCVDADNASPVVQFSIATTLLLLAAFSVLM